VELGFELKALNTDALPLEPYLQSISALIILEMGPQQLFAWAGLKQQSSS
jgi:hypothetical protein